MLRREFYVSRQLAAGSWQKCTSAYSAGGVCRIARCPLPAARCPLPAARCPLPAARCDLPPVL